MEAVDNVLIVLVLLLFLLELGHMTQKVNDT